MKAGDFVFVDGGVPHAIGGGCFIIELQEPSDLMVVAERFTPSGRQIPEGKLHGGLGFERMHDVYVYDGVSYEDLCAKYVRRGGASAAGATRILGPELTDKFEMWRLSGDARLELGGAGTVAVVTDGAGTLNGVPVAKGDRLVVSGEDELETDVNGRLPEPNERCTLGVVDLQDGTTFIPVTTTACWNFQEAAMAFWMDNDTILFNDVRDITPAE